MWMPILKINTISLLSFQSDQLNMPKINITICFNLLLLRCYFFVCFFAIFHVYTRHIKIRWKSRIPLAVSLAFIFSFLFFYPTLHLLFTIDNELPHGGRITVIPSLSFISSVLSSKAVNGLPVEGTKIVSMLTSSVLTLHNTRLMFHFRHMCLVLNNIIHYCLLFICYLLSARPTNYCSPIILSSLLMRGNVF